MPFITKRRLLQCLRSRCSARSNARPHRHKGSREVSSNDRGQLKMSRYRRQVAKPRPRDYLSLVPRQLKPRNTHLTVSPLIIIRSSHSSYGNYRITLTLISHGTIRNCHTSIIKCGREIVSFLGMRKVTKFLTPLYKCVCRANARKLFLRTRVESVIGR